MHIDVLVHYRRLLGRSILGCRCAIAAARSAGLIAARRWSTVGITRWLWTGCHQRNAGQDEHDLRQNRTEWKGMRWETRHRHSDTMRAARERRRNLPHNWAALCLVFVGIALDRDRCGIYPLTMCDTRRCVLRPG